MLIYLYYNSAYVCLSVFAKCRSQFLLDLLGISLTVIVSSESTSCHEFAFQFGLEFFYTRKNPNYRKGRVARALFISMSCRSASVSPASERVRPTMTVSWLGAPIQRTATVVGGVCACVRDVFAIYDDNILPWLIMIIIKIIILYFIQIRHTDDLPSTGIPASYYNHNSGAVIQRNSRFTVTLAQSQRIFHSVMNMALVSVIRSPLH